MKTASGRFLRPLAVSYFEKIEPNDRTHLHEFGTAVEAEATMELLTNENLVPINCDKTRLSPSSEASS